MRFEERKTMSRVELAILLRRLAEKLESGVLDYTGGEVPVPEKMEVEVEYKEKDTSKKFELELRWSGGMDASMPSKSESKLAVAEAAKPKKEQREECEGLPTHMDEVKSELKNVFRALQLQLDGNKMPDMRDVSAMRELNSDFEKYSAGKGWHIEEHAFTAKMAELEKAVMRGDLENAKKLMEELRADKKSCHRNYRWKQ